MLFNDDDGSYGTNGRDAATTSLGGHCGGDLNGVVLQRR